MLINPDTEPQAMTSFCVTLVSLEPTALYEAAAGVATAVQAEEPLRWLSAGQACDVLCVSPEAENALSLRDTVARAVDKAPVDFCVQPEHAYTRRKQLLIADMDATIIGQESLDELADIQGIGAQISAITERAMRGEIDFETALEKRIGLLSGLRKEDALRVLKEKITLNQGARTLVQTMKAHGARTVLVSGGFTLFSEVIASRAGFDAQRANEFVWQDGALAGVKKPVLGREAKLAVLTEQAASLGISPADVIAAGDGANDLAMIRAAGLGVAYHAKPAVAAEADACVDYTDLTALLYFQGYHRSEFVEEASDAF